MKPTFLLALLQIAFAATAFGINIQLDFSYDNANGGFFNANQTARLAVQAAAADLSAAVLPSLGAVTTDVFTGTTSVPAGTTTATLDWALRIQNPATANTIVELQTFTFAADAVTIYVAMRPFGETFLGEGGPASTRLTIGAQGPSAQWDSALDKAEAASTAVMRRGGGPVVHSFVGNRAYGSSPGNYSLPFGALAGSLSMDSDSDNNGIADSADVLANYWHFDHTTPVAAGKNDFYSTALHEMIHVIGIGTTETWTSLRSGSTWFGTNAIAANGGTGSGLLSDDGSHIAPGKTSPRLFDGVLQEVAMDPSITVGTRKYLTEMDVAFLRDIGYATIPEPSAAVLLLLGVSGLANRRRRG